MNIKFVRNQLNFRSIIRRDFA